MLFDRRRIRAPHLLMQFAPGVRDLDELAALVDLAFAARGQALVDQPVDQPRRGILRIQAAVASVDGLRFMA